MKVRVLKITKVLLAVMFALGVLFLASPSEAQAAKKMTNKSAQKILKKKIKNKFCRYAFADIDNDKIDEMIVLGYSGKFVDGDDKKKSLTVYKVVGKKAKSVLSYSREGDSFHPTLSFNLYYDSSDCYITINDVHEGYATYKTYIWGADSFNEIAMISADLATPKYEYRFRNKGGLKVCTKEEYFEYMDDILAGEVEVELNSSSTKVQNKYLKKMLKAEFSYRCKLGIYNKKTASTEYKDVNNDGIDELIVRTGETEGEVLYVRFPDEEISDYFISSANLAALIGNIKVTTPEDQGDENWGEIDGEQYLGFYQCDRCSIDIVREGAAAFVFDIHWGSSAFDTDQWIYFAFYQGEDKNTGKAYFVCSDGGSHVTHHTDMDTEEEETIVHSTKEMAEFVFEDGKLYWHDLTDDTKANWDMAFEKIG